MTRIVLTGAGGQLGRAVRDQAAIGIDLHPFDSGGLDITDADAVGRVLAEVRPDVVINAAAYTAVDRAESEIDAAHRVNVDGARNLALGCERAGARLIHVSTDFVFDGDSSRPYAPSAETNPLGVYGRTKRDGEREIMKLLPGNSTIVRTAWIYGAVGGNFVLTMLRLLRERDELGVVMDQVGSPTSSIGLASALLELAVSGRGVGEILHWTDAGVASWYDLAVAVREFADRAWPDARWGQVKPIYTEDYPTPARRPHFSVLDCRQDAWGGLPRRHWRDALGEVMAKLAAQSE